MKNLGTVSGKNSVGLCIATHFDWVFDLSIPADDSFIRANDFSLVANPLYLARTS
jgi:hypothetical protein